MKKRIGGFKIWNIYFMSLSVVYNLSAKTITLTNGSSDIL